MRATPLLNLPRSRAPLSSHRPERSARSSSERRSCFEILVYGNLAWHDGAVNSSWSVSFGTASKSCLGYPAHIGPMTHEEFLNFLLQKFKESFWL